MRALEIPKPYPILVKSLDTMIISMFYFKILHKGLRQYGMHLSGILLLVVTICSLIPPAQTQDPVVYIDKVFHLLAYAALTFPCSISVPKKNLLWLIGACIWGAGIECLQPSFGRTADVIDAFCNGLGAAMGTFLAIVFIRLHISASPTETRQTS